MILLHGCIAARTVRDVNLQHLLHKHHLGHYKLFTYLNDSCGGTLWAPSLSLKKGISIILVVTDIFTNWEEAFPLQNTLSVTSAIVLVNEVICQFGVPSYLHSDQGNNLCNEVVQNVCKLLGINTTRTSSPRKWSGGTI